MKNSNRFVRLIDGLKARMALHLLRAMRESVGGGLCTDRNGRVKLERKRIQKIFSLDAGLMFDQQKAIEGLRPSFSAHVRFGERGVPVPFPLTLVERGASA